MLEYLTQETLESLNDAMAYVQSLLLLLVGLVFIAVDFVTLLSVVGNHQMQI